VRIALALCAALGAFACSANPAGADRNAYRAAVSYWAMQHTFLDRSHGVYREESGRGDTARAWPYSQALAATLAMTKCLAPPVAESPPLRKVAAFVEMRSPARCDSQE